MKWSTKNVIKCSAKHLKRDFWRKFIACAIFKSSRKKSLLTWFVTHEALWGDERYINKKVANETQRFANKFCIQTHLPHFVMIISVPILWNSDHKSALWSFTSAPGRVKRGGMGGSWRDGNIDAYGSEIKNWNRSSIKLWVLKLKFFRFSSRTRFNLFKKNFLNSKLCNEKKTAAAQ